MIALYDNTHYGKSALRGGSAREWATGVRGLRAARDRERGAGLRAARGAAGGLGGAAAGGAQPQGHLGQLRAEGDRRHRGGDRGGGREGRGRLGAGRAGGRGGGGGGRGAAPGRGAWGP